MQFNQRIELSWNQKLKTTWEGALVLYRYVPLHDILNDVDVGVGKLIFQPLHDERLLLLACGVLRHVALSQRLHGRLPVVVLPESRSHKQKMTGVQGEWHNDRKQVELGVHWKHNQ